MNSKYRIELAPLAQRQLKKLPEQIKKTLIKKLETLKLTPFPPVIKKLTGMNELYRLRMGDYRIVYKVEQAILLILVLKIGHRRDIYKKLPSTNQ